MQSGPWHPILCFSLLLLSTSGDSDVAPRFITEPLSTIQNRGSAVILLCSAEPPQSHTSWMFNGELLEKGQDLQIKPGHLTILSLSLQHVGRYQCLVNSSQGSIISAPANVSMAYLGEFESSSKLTVTAEEGSNVIIACHAPHSVPQAQRHYRVRGKWLDRSTEKYVILPSGNLMIINVSSEDQGPYRCAVYNPVTHERKISPSVYKLSMGRSSPHDVAVIQPMITHSLSVKLHGPLTLECTIGGMTLPSVLWYKDGREATEDRRRKLLHTHLVIDNAERADSGNYSCVLGNGSQEVAGINYTVTVEEAPYISRAPVDELVLVGSDASFTCGAHGSPMPKVTWLHNAAPIHSSLRLHLLGNKLHITNVMAGDSGMYQCMADNGVGVAQSAARLHVQSDVTTRPVIVSPPASVSVIYGDLVTLTCNATGTPAPSIRWYDDNGIISSHPSKILRPKTRKASQSRVAASPNKDPAPVIKSQAGSSSLYISAATMQHAGKYVCEAANQFGVARAEATMTVVPYEMSTVRADITQSGIIQSNKDAIQTSAHPTDKPFNVAMLPEAPIILSPPQTTKPDVYFLMWRPGQDGGLPINAYFVRYRKLDDEGNVVGSWSSIRVPASENEFPLTELEPSSLYEVLMVARNAAGEGQPAMLTFRTSKERTSSSKNTQAPSPPAGAPRQKHPHVAFNGNLGLLPQDSFRHSGVPEAPDRPTISTASETSVYVTWIPRANGGSPITSFKVEYKRSGRHWMTAADNIPPSKLSVEVSNLEPGAMYKFRVIAINTYGESLRSTASRPYQVAGYSSRLLNPLIVGPRIDHTEAVTDTQILLKWTYIAANNNNTPIQGFYVYYRPTDSDNDSDYKMDVLEGGTKHQHLISHLQPETSYDIKMQCYNERGASDYSNVMMCETKARRSPGATEYPMVELDTPPSSDRVGGGGSSSTLARSGDMLYVIVGCVLSGMVLILLTFIAICLLKHRQQTLMNKFQSPGYLYQGSDLNGQMIEYTTLPGTSRINGNIHGSFMGNGNIPNGYPHIHHSVHGGNGVINGDLSPTCPNSLKETCPDYEHSPHNISNGGVLYTSVPQTEPSDCQNCRNCCNNNRCFSKLNGSYNSNGVTRTPFHQDDQETKSPGAISVPICLYPHEGESPQQAEVTVTEKEPETPPPSYDDEMEEIKSVSCR